MDGIGKDNAEWNRTMEEAAARSNSSTPKILDLNRAVKSSTGHLPSLELLELFASSIEVLSIADARLSLLAELPVLRILRNLYLPNNLLSGAATLDTVVKPCGATLRLLDLGNNRFAQVDELEPLARLGVESLDLRQCPVTQVNGYTEKVSN